MNKVEFTIGGKKYIAKIGLYFLEKVTKGEDISIQMIFEKMEADALLFTPKLVKYAIEAGGSEISIEQIYDWLDEAGFWNPEIQNFVSSLIKSFEVHTQNEPNVGKRKATAKK